MLLKGIDWAQQAVLPCPDLGSSQSQDKWNGMIEAITKETKKNYTQWQQAALNISLDVSFIASKID